MKIVTAIIKPFKLDDVRNALTAIGGADARTGTQKFFGVTNVR